MANKTKPIAERPRINPTQPKRAGAPDAPRVKVQRPGKTAAAAPPNASN